MSRVLFTNGSVHGHINPTLPLVRELAQRGEEVHYFSTAEFKDKIIEEGAVYVDAGESLAEFNRSYKPAGNHPFYKLIDYILEADKVMLPLIYEKAAEIKPDYMIHDALFGAGKIVGRQMDIPCVCSCTSFAMNRLPLPAHMLEPGFHPELDALYLKMEAAAKEWEMEQLSIMDLFFKKAGLNIVFTSKEFQPDAGNFDESFRFVGASISERKEQVDFPVHELEAADVIYISMGTINNKLEEFYRKCIEAFTGTNYKVVLSIGKKTDISVLGSIPGNFSVWDYVPQLEVLKRSSAFICHGGMNSVNEAFYYGVPVVAIPLANDQFMVSRYLAASGAGISLKMEEVTPGLLRESVFNILMDSSFKTASEGIGASFRAAGGYKAAAEHILNWKSC